VATSVDLRDFLEPEEITGDYIDGVIDETVPRQRQILNYVSLEEHDDDKIEARVWIQQKDKQATITGFGDRYARRKGMRVEEMRIEPFTMKDGRSWDVEDDEIELDGDGRPMVARSGIVEGTGYLEDLRRTLQVNAVLSALNDKSFVYDQGDVKLDIPYDGHVVDDTGPSVDFDNSSCNPHYEYKKLIERYYQDIGQRPNLAFVNGVTAAEILKLDDLNQKYIPQQPSDPDGTPETFDLFYVEGILHVVLHDKYPKADGSLSDPVDEGWGIFTVQQLREDQRPAIRWHRASTKLNGRDASSPAYETFVEDRETKSVVLGMYDNGIPGFGKRKVARRFKYYTP